MSEQLVLTEVRGQIGLMTVNRPQVHNALSTPTVLAMEQALTELEQDERVRVIVATGAGDKAFIAGGDLSEMNNRQGLAHYEEFAEDIHRVFRRFETCDKPTISAVNGWALGGGTEFLLSTDIRVLADHAVLALPEITLGLFPGAGGTQRMIRQVPLCVAKELMFTGDRIKADEAVRIGLANKVVPKDKLLQAISGNGQTQQAQAGTQGIEQRQADRPQGQRQPHRQQAQQAQAYEQRTWLDPLFHCAKLAWAAG